MGRGVQPIGLAKLIEELGLRVPEPAVRSEAVRGARKTKISDDSILEQYPRTYAPNDLLGHLRFAMRYEPLDIGVLTSWSLHSAWYGKPRKMLKPHPLDGLPLFRLIRIRQL